MAKIKKLTGKAYDKIYGTSFHNGTIWASFNELEKKLGVKPTCTDDGKTNYELALSINGITATIYDWKEGTIGTNTVVWLHIGTKDILDTLKVCNILENEYGLKVRTGSPESNLLEAIFGSTAKK